MFYFCYLSHNLSQKLYMRLLKPVLLKLNFFSLILSKILFVSEDEAKALQRVLQSLSEELSDFCRQSGPVPSTEKASAPLQLRAKALKAELAKTQLVVSYLGHQLAAAAVKTLATSRYDKNMPTWKIHKLSAV